MGPGFCPEFGCRALPARCIWQGSGFAADQTNAMLAVVRADDESLVLPKPLHWVSAGALLGEVIKTPVSHFFTPLCGGGITTLRPLWLCRNNPARGLFQQKKRLSQSGCSAPTDTLFPPAHSAFSTLLRGGGITTLGVRFMPLKHWTRRSYSGVFAVFMPPQCSPCAG